MGYSAKTLKVIAVTGAGAALATLSAVSAFASNDEAGPSSAAHVADDSAKLVDQIGALPPPPPVPAQRSVSQPPLPPLPKLGGGSETHIKTKHYEFDYSYPVEVVALPKLQAELNADAAGLLSELSETTDEYLKEYRPPDYERPPLTMSKSWAVAGDIPRFLSMLASESSYMGGAHGNFAYEAKLWDRGANDDRDPAELFTSAGAMSSVLGAPYCAGLQQERAAKRGDWTPDPNSEFDKCVPPSKAKITFQTSDNEQFDAIVLSVGPYVAGAYVEGDYVVCLPLTAQMIAGMKPEYRRYFRSDGSCHEDTE